MEYENLLKKLEVANSLDNSTELYLQVIRDLMAESCSRIEFDDATFALLAYGIRPVDSPSLDVLLHAIPFFDKFTWRNQLTLISELLTTINGPIT